MLLQKIRFTFSFGQAVFHCVNVPQLFFFFKTLFILFLEKGREGETEGEKHQCVIPFWVSPTGDLACNSGMCPDWESNHRPFGLQAKCSNHWAKTARAVPQLFYPLIYWWAHGSKRPFDVSPCPILPLGASLNPMYNFQMSLLLLTLFNCPLISWQTADNKCAYRKNYTYTQALLLKMSVITS